MALTPQQTEELRGMIDRRRRALENEIREDVAKARGEEFRDIAGAVPDPGDESVATLIQDLDQADVSRDVNELRELEAAVQRMAEGTYGICVDCGNDIDYRRLLVYPAAARDIRCQEIYEKTHAVAARASL
jgi:RNA polymerase-binding transcription factor DksA